MPSHLISAWNCLARYCEPQSCRRPRPRVYKYGIHLTPGLTEVRSYAAFFTSFLAEGLRVRFRAIPALKTA
jgi:hypothetical protein